MAVRPEGARAPLFCLTRLVLPGFVNKFQTVTVRVFDLGGEIAGVVMQLRPRRVDFGRTRRKGCLMGGADLGFGVRHKAHMHGARRRRALTQPEERPPVRAKSCQVGMAFGAVLARVIVARRDPQMRQDGLVKCDRAFNFRNRQEDVS